MGMGMGGGMNPQMGMGGGMNPQMGMGGGMGMQGGMGMVTPLTFCFWRT
jgi:hypothetical protein